MNILFVTNHPPNDGSGQSIVSFELAKAFLKTGNKIGIIYPSNKTELFLNPEGLIEFKVSSIGDETFKAMNLLPNKISAINNFIADFNPDIIHSQAELFLGVIVQLWAVKHKIPFLQTIHFPFSKAKEAEAKNSSLDLLYKFIIKIGISKEYLNSYYQNCTAIIALNETILKDIKTTGYKGKTYIIPNAIDKDTFSKIKEPELKTRINLLYVGTLCKRKNQQYLVSAMRYLPNSYHLTLVGSSTNKKYFNDLLDYIKTHKIKNVTLAGRVDYNKIPEFISKSQIFVSASTTEMQSMAVMEALAGARPVISLTNETTAGLVTPEVGIVLSQDTTPAEFANQIRILVKEKQKYFSMVKNCRKKMRNHTWDIVVKKTESVYRNLIAENNKFVTSKKYLQAVNKIPNKYLRKFLTKIQPKPKKMLEYKIKPKSAIIAGGAIASSIVIFGILKILQKMKKK